MSETPPPRPILESVIDATCDVGILLDSGGQVLEVFRNDSDGDGDGGVFGTDPSELTDGTVWDALPATEVEQVRAATRDAVDRGETQTAEIRTHARNGARRTEVQAVPIGDEEPGHTLLLLEDLTRQSQAQRAGDVLSRVFEVAPVGLVVVEPSGDISRANERAEEILGLERAEITSRTYMESEWKITYDDGTAISVDEHPVTKVIRTGEPVMGLEHWIELPDGTKRWLSSHSAPVLDDQGNVERVIVGLDDMTSAKAREERLEWLVKNEELASVGGWELDPETGTVEGTAGMSRLHGGDGYPMSLEETLDLYHPDDRQQIRDAITSCCENGTPFEVEGRRRTVDGYERWVRIVGERIGDQGSQTVRGIVRDITEDKEREQRISVMNRVLRHNIKNRVNVILGRAGLVREELETVDIPNRLETKREAVLNSVERAAAETESLQSEVRLLEELLGDLSDVSIERAETSLDSIATASRELTELAEKVRDLDAAIERIDTAHRVELRSVISGLLDRYAAEYPEADVDVSGAEVTVTGSREVLRLILEIPIENALEHCEQPSLSVSVAAAEAPEGRIVVTIEDDGPGIPETERKLLQAPKETPTVHSTGVGLWTMQWLTRRIGGSVSVGERDAGGTVVELTLPTTPRAEPVRVDGG